MLRFVGVKVVVVHPHEPDDDASRAGRPRPTHRLVHAIGEYVQATGMSGADGAPRWLIAVDGAGNSTVNADLVRHVIDDYTPVIETVAVNEAGDPESTDPDVAASRLAIALGAYKAIFVVGDQRLAIEDEGDLSEMRTTPDVLERVTVHADLAGPLRAARMAVESGSVRYGHLVPDNSPHAVLLELFTDEGFGTKLRSADDWDAAVDSDGFPAVGYFCWE